MCKNVQVGACPVGAARARHIGQDRRDKMIVNLTKVADMIGVSKRTLYNMIQDGRFPVRPIPRSNPRKWSVDDVKAWIAGTYV